MDCRGRFGVFGAQGEVLRDSRIWTQSLGEEVAELESTIE